MSDLNRLDDMVLSSPQLSVDTARGITLTRQSGLPLQLPRNEERLVQHSARRQRHLAAKRLFDVVMSSLALFALFPLFLITALLIKVSSAGPVLFSQEREGCGGRVFKALKFRSMRAAECDLSGVAQTTKDDPRVTAVGRFIRRTSIDELPQLINVLMGDMALVGPRPHVAGMRAGGVLYKELVPYHDLRLEMPPGLTGWAQANGLRGPTVRADLAWARIDHDIAYIQNFSFWLDMKVILMTLRYEFVGGSGY